MISRVCKLPVKSVFIHGPPSRAIEAILSDKTETSLRPIVYCFAIIVKLLVFLTSPGCRMCRSLNVLIFLLQFGVKIETVHMGFLKNLHPRAWIPKNITVDDNIHRVLEDWVPLDLVEKIVENNFLVIGSKLDTRWQLHM